MNTRLTLSLRLMIVANVMEKAFSKEEAEIKQSRIELGEAFYFSNVTVEQEKLADKLPREFFRITDELRDIRFTNPASSKGHEMVIISVLFKKERRIPFIMTATRSAESLSLYKQAERIEALEEALRDKRHTLREEINNVLKGATTVKALIKIWPKGKQFIPAEALSPQVRKQLPARLITSLDKLLESAQAF